MSDLRIRQIYLHLDGGDVGYGHHQRVGRREDNVVVCRRRISAVPVDAVLPVGDVGVAVELGAHHIGGHRETVLRGTAAATPPVSIVTVAPKAN